MEEQKNRGPDLRDFTRRELEELIISLGGKKTAAQAVFNWLYKYASGRLPPGFPVSLKIKLCETCSLRPVETVERRVSGRDGTVKLLFRFYDGAVAESVVLPGKGRVSACLSSQAGCACGCVFCSTGAMGFRRDLKPSEITAQFAACRREAGGRLDSVVFMGMGEPFLNWENVKKAILILSDGGGYGFSQGKMTVSTVGVAPMIRELAGTELKIKLAISIVTADEKERARLVPMEAKYPLREVLEAARRYCAARDAQVFVEYILFSGKNDSPEAARRLIRLLKGLNCRVNLIPFNPPGGGAGGAGAWERAREFQKLVIASGIRAYLRLEKGADIMAACGQLAGRPAAG